MADLRATVRPSRGAKPSRIALAGATAPLAVAGRRVSVGDEAALEVVVGGEDSGIHELPLRPRSTPVSPLVVDGRHYIIAGLPQSDWARNVRSAGRGELTKGRTVTPVSLTGVLDPQVRLQVVSSFPREVSHGVQFFVRNGLVRPAQKPSSPPSATKWQCSRWVDFRP